MRAAIKVIYVAFVFVVTVTVLRAQNASMLSDKNGPSFHRFQILAWIRSAIFIASVVQTLDMPTFSSTLLGLMGISSGACLGFRFPEQKTP
jgi:hypothetical protein